MGFFVPEYVYKQKIKNNLDWGFKIKVGNEYDAETEISFFPNKEGNGNLYNAPLAWKLEV